MIFAFLIFATVLFLFSAVRSKKEEKRLALQARITGEEDSKESGTGKKRKSFLVYMDELGAQSGIRRSRREWILLLITFMCGGLLLGILLAVGWFLSILFGAGAVSLYILYLKWKKQKYLDAFRYGLQDLTEYAISFFQVSPDMEPVLREVVNKSKNKVLVHECKEILREVDGLENPPLKVMRKRAKESGISEYVLLVEMTQSALETNASLVTIYRDLNESIRRYFGVEKKILAKTSAWRKVGFGLAFLPLPAFMFFWSSIKPMLHGALLILFYVVIAIVLYGVFVLNRVVKVRV